MEAVPDAVAAFIVAVAVSDAAVVALAVAVALDIAIRVAVPSCSCCYCYGGLALVITNNADSWKGRNHFLLLGRTFEVKFYPS